MLLPSRDGGTKCNTARSSVRSARSIHAPASSRRPCLKWRTYTRANGTVVGCLGRLRPAGVRCAGAAAGVCAGCCCAVSGPGRQHSHARVMFMHVALFECIACVRAHRRAVPSLLQRRGRPCACSESDVGCRAAGATSAMRNTLIFAWCCVVRVLSVLRVAGASSFPRWTPLRCGWRDCEPAAGALPVTRTVRPLPSPKYSISVRRDGGGCVRACGTAS